MWLLCQPSNRTLSNQLLICNGPISSPQPKTNLRHSTIWLVSLKLAPLIRRIWRWKEQVSAQWTIHRAVSILMLWRLWGRMPMKRIKRVLFCPSSIWKNPRTRLNWVSMRRRRQKFTKRSRRHTRTDTFISLIRKLKSRKRSRRSLSCTRPMTGSVYPTCSGADKWSELVPTNEYNSQKPRKLCNSRSKLLWLKLPTSLVIIVSINCTRSSNCCLIIDHKVQAFSIQIVQIPSRNKMYRLQWALDWAQLQRQVSQTLSTWCSWNWSVITQFAAMLVEVRASIIAPNHQRMQKVMIAESALGNNCAISNPTYLLLSRNKTMTSSLISTWSIESNLRLSASYSMITIMCTSLCTKSMRR